MTYAAIYQLSGMHSLQAGAWDEAHACSHLSITAPGVRTESYAAM